MEIPTNKWKFLSGSWLKMLAMFTMLLDHVAGFLLFRNPELQTLLFTLRGHSITVYVLLRMIGRLAFPLFAFLLVEGFQHTRNRKQYGLNLFLFALLSEIPFNLMRSGRCMSCGNPVVRAVVGCAALPSHVIGGMAFVPIALLPNTCSMPFTRFTCW